jgi:hypothetical protein
LFGGAWVNYCTVQYEKLPGRLGCRCHVECAGRGTESSSLVSLNTSQCGGLYVCMYAMDVCVVRDAAAQAPTSQPSTPVSSLLFPCTTCAGIKAASAHGPDLLWLAASRTRREGGRLFRRRQLLLHCISPTRCVEARRYTSSSPRTRGKKKTAGKIACVRARSGSLAVSMSMAVCNSCGKHSVVLYYAMGTSWPR